MNTIFENTVTLGIIVGFALALFLFQIIILMRVKNILQQIAFYIECISRFFYRVGISPNANRRQDILKTCQYCKFRLSYMHMSEQKNEIEDFYYKCQIRNIEISLEDSCKQFEKDES